MSVFLKKGVAFPISMFMSSAIMVASYWAYAKLLIRFGVQI
jgi:hypothetical protein